MVFLLALYGSSFLSVQLFPVLLVRPLQLRGAPQGMPQSSGIPGGYGSLTFSMAPGTLLFMTHQALLPWRGGAGLTDHHGVTLLCNIQPFLCGQDTNPSNPGNRARIHLPGPPAMPEISSQHVWHYYKTRCKKSNDWGAVSARF